MWIRLFACKRKATSTRCLVKKSLQKTYFTLIKILEGPSKTQLNWIKIQFWSRFLKGKPSSFSQIFIYTRKNELKGCILEKKKDMHFEQSLNWDTRGSCRMITTGFFLMRTVCSFIAFPFPITKAENESKKDEHNSAKRSSNNDCNCLIVVTWGNWSGTVGGIIVWKKKGWMTMFGSHWIQFRKSPTVVRAT